jgi:hypothetical protein
MPMKLSTTINTIISIPNSANAELLREFYQYMKANGTSESYQNGNLKTMIYPRVIVQKRVEGKDSKYRICKLHMMCIKCMIS